MSRTLQILGASYAESLLLARYAPRYSIGTITTSILLFSLQFTLFLFYRIVIYPRFFSPIRHLPEVPNGDFFLGQTKRVIAAASGTPMREWTANVPNNGLIRYSMWFQERVLVTTPAALSEVLVTKNYDFIKPPQVRNGLGRILGIGILLAEGEEHKIQRKNLMPAFAFRHIKNIYPVFWSKGRELTDCLAAACKATDAVVDEHNISDTDNHTTGTKHQPGAIDVGNWASRATLDIIGLSGMGQDFDSLHDPTNKLSKTYQDVFNPGPTGRILQLMGLFVPFWIVRNLPLKRNHEINGAAEYIKQVCRDMIAKRHAAKEKEGATEVGTDILSIALESGGFADEELVNQMMTFLVAGHETTATAMIWAFYELCKHPEVQTKLRAEIRSKIPSADSEITAAQIDDCHYLQAVTLEILRLWSPVALTLRIAEKDTSIAGEMIPKSTMVILSPWATNTNKSLWGADGMEFKPERWLNADGKANSKGSADSNYAFLTFLHGPRSCIGQKFAQAEFACLLACWVGRFDTRFEEGSALIDGEPQIKGGVTSKIKGGLWCNLTEVEGW